MTAAAAPVRDNKLAKIVGTSVAASSIEWYDFFIYGTAAALVFPKLFFPADMPPAVAQIAAFSTFAVGFIARPIGGMIFGHFGDLVGRKKALVVALLVMGTATTLIGCLPSYATVGVAAPLALVLLRFAQGLAVGGQWGGAALLATESAPPGKKGFYGSFPQLGVPTGVVLANLIFLIMTANFAPETFAAWGWRVPFLLSVLLVGLGLYVQLKLEDTPEFKALEEAKGAQAQGAQQSPILQAIRRHPKEILLAAGSFVASNGCFYLVITFLVSYCVTNLGMDRPKVLWALLVGTLLSAPSLPISGWLSDRYGRRGVYMVGAVLGGVWAFALWPLVDAQGFWGMVLGIAVASVFLNFMYGPQSALFSELFSAEIRYSGASLGYQLGAIVGGGFAPIIATALLAEYKTSAVIAAYMAALCTISFVSILLLAETNKREHRTP
ncbi:MFS transporter [Phenylobacterium sp.]|uniref:MFS transporter n=1 Tax=Phenylobacterium sp. TaxID=1871053 RepID=UPI0025DBE759|nr:MFS transporter [Phenylobacterium sp.]MBX3482681.1 MHS family MFS transporter [Phenylobacterium sp.]MCW5760455.1 MHS family MFS transporter [Phenylobacterium sp.]